VTELEQRRGGCHSVRCPWPRADAASSAPTEGIPSMQNVGADVTRPSGHVTAQARLWPSATSAPCQSRASLAFASTGRAPGWPPRSSGSQSCSSRPLLACFPAKSQKLEPVAMTPRHRIVRPRDEMNGVSPRDVDIRRPPPPSLRRKQATKPSAREWPQSIRLATGTRDQR
jgi:hypothetical protein